MPEALHTLVATVLALLPGALYVWSYERVAGQWGINFPDRLLRFFGVSAVLWVLTAPVTYWIWNHYWRDDRWKADSHLDWQLYGLLLLYVAVPIVLGLLLGAANSHGWPIGRWVHGERRPPRAWDYLFSQRPDGWVRLRTKSGAWIGGAFAKGAFASGYPSDGQDLLVETAEIDPYTGAFKKDEGGNVILQEKSYLLVNWDEVEYLEFVDA